MEHSFVLIKTLPIIIIIDLTRLVAILLHFESEIVPWFVLQIFSKSYSNFCMGECQIWD